MISRPGLYDPQKSACFSVTIAENRLICIKTAIVPQKSTEICGTISKLHVKKEVHYVSVLNYVLLTFDSELSCGSAGCF